MAGSGMRTTAAPRSVGAGAAWPAFATTFVAAALLAGLALFGAAAVLDPYGFRAAPGRMPGPIMDINGRYMYPQLARGGRFDSAIFGTSTIRLLDPAALDTAFGGRFVNLGLNAGTPWEQLELASLFLRHQPRPATLVMGLDRNWCEADADALAKRITFRAFPSWLYDEDPLNDWPRLVSLRSLEIASRVLLHRLGRMPERIRGDGYENFLPPETDWDAGRAAAHIHAPDPAGGEAPTGVQERPGVLPALDWLDGFVARLPPATRLVLVLPPIHVAAQAVPGTPAAVADAACKARIAALSSRQNTTIVDFRRPSALTRDDARYWDKLHYRQPVAAGIVADLAAAVRTGRDGGDGLYGVLSAR